jgi:hypothetical protein
MARDQHSRVYSCILLTTLVPPRCLFTGTLSTGGEPGDIHRHTRHTVTGHAGAQGHSTGTVHVSRLCPGSPGDRYMSFYRYRYRYRCFRVCPGSPRCLFTGTGQFFLPVPVQYCTGCPGSPRCLFTGTRYRVPVVSFYR